jgi:hypothetical protein
MERLPFAAPTIFHYNLTKGCLVPQSRNNVNEAKHLKTSNEEELFTWERQMLSTFISVTDSYLKYNGSRNSFYPRRGLKPIYIYRL